MRVSFIIFYRKQGRNISKPLENMAKM